MQIQPYGNLASIIWQTKRAILFSVCSTAISSNWYLHSFVCALNLVFSSTMNRLLIRVLPVLVFLFFHVSNSEDEEVKQSLVRFMDKLAAVNVERDHSWGWNMTSDPCKHKWKGVTCDSRLKSVKKVVLDELNLTGVLDIGSICKASSLLVLSIVENDVVGSISEEMGSCKRLTHLYLSGNQLAGNLPDSLKQLSNLKRFDISNNNFSGKVPDLSRTSGLLTFLAQNNQLSGEIPKLDFSNLIQFNVSNNNFTGPVPDVKGRFSAESWSGNPELGGELMSKPSPPPSSSSPAPQSPPKSKSSSRKELLIYSGYAVLGFIILLVVAFVLVIKTKPKEDKADAAEKGVNVNVYSTSSYDESKITERKSEYSATSEESGVPLSSLVLRSPMARSLKFKDLLRAPAELLGKGKHGSLYKVMLDNGATTLAVKRIRDWSITSQDFKRRMQRLHQARHPNILPSVAFYSSKDEKLLVYEYQPNGNLSRLLHGFQNEQALDCGSRLYIAATIAEALAYMHEELHEEGIAHGNLKSTNILFNKNMEPCVSEYGLTVSGNDNASSKSRSNSFKANALDPAHTFKADIYGFGVILLELITGKLVQDNAFELVQWVQSVVREEWTVEVFDRGLILEGGSEERLLILLRIALRCINLNSHERPNMSEVAVMINTLKDEEDKSSSSP